MPESVRFSVNNKVLGLLGIACRARKVVTGDSVVAAVRQNKAKLVLLCSDCGSNAQKKIQDKCRFYGVEWIVEGTAEELSAALGQPRRIAAAILDEGLARAIQDAVMK